MDKKLHELTNCPKCGQIVPRHQTYGSCPNCKNKACFPAGTSVRTEDGIRPIEQIKSGDRVIAVDRKGKLITRAVRRFHRYAPTSISEIEFDDGARLRVTDHHTVKSSRGWVMVRELKASDTLVTAVAETAKSTRQIVNIRRAVTTEPVYNLIIEGDCTFIADGIVSHSFTQMRIIRTAVERLRFAVVSGLRRTKCQQTEATSCVQQHSMMRRRILLSVICVLLMGIGNSVVDAQQTPTQSLRDSAFTYFQRGKRRSVTNSTEFQLGDDYAKLRRKSYLPTLPDPQTRAKDEPVVVQIPNGKAIKLIDDAGFRFRNTTLSDIFYGRFALIHQRDRNTFRGAERFQGRLKTLIDAVSENADARMVINAYVDEANKRYGADQVNGAKPWKNTTSMVTYRGAIETNRQTLSEQNYFVDAKLSALYGRDPKGQRSALSVIMKTRTGTLDYILDISKDTAEFFDKWQKGTSAHAQLIENLIRFHSRSQSLQDEAGGVVQATSKDRFFSNAVYAAWTDGHKIPGRYISASLQDKEVGTSELSAEAVRRFLALAAENQIKESDITAAMISGNLNPDPIDVLLIHKGLAPNNDESIKDEIFRFAVANHLAKETDSPADVLNFQNALGRADLIYLGYRETEWIRRFGGLEKAIGKHTVFNGQTKRLEMTDIYNKLGLRLQKEAPASRSRSGRRRSRS